MVAHDANHAYSPPKYAYFCGQCTERVAYDEKAQKPSIYSANTSVN
jgi:hypothetical protein